MIFLCQTLNRINYFKCNEKLTILGTSGRDNFVDAVAASLSADLADSLSDSLLDLEYSATDLEDSATDLEDSATDLAAVLAVVTVVT